MISKTLELDNTFCPVLMACGCNMIRSIVLPDRKLLACYVAEGSEPAFAEVVAQHVNLVYSAALRRTGGNVELAKEATQLVFTSLARKAGSLPDNVVLASWLHKATHYPELVEALCQLRLRQGALDGEIVAKPSSTGPAPAAGAALSSTSLSTS